MNFKIVSILILLLAVTVVSSQPKPTIEEPISLHPNNPKYFLFNGKSTILVTSGEHYGAVMNADFNYKKYLETIKAEGFNYTRIFIGPYSETGDHTFGISNNTMNPKPESWVTPWVKDSISNKYDLNKWNPFFFDRLKAFLQTASENNVIVEITLFTSYYTNHQWSTSPFNSKNNLRKTDSVSFKKVNTLNNGNLIGYQEGYVTKIVRETNHFGNIFFEIQNEPWSDNPEFVEKIAETDTLTHPANWQSIVETANKESLEWQSRIAQIIINEESKLPNKHLIAQNISNFRYKIENPDNNISIFNFHYAYPEAVLLNSGLQKVTGLDETGFMPKDNFLYRSQAWKFMLAGGALYNNLDYSFTVENEDGKYKIDSGTPGWGGNEFRRQIRFLKHFIESFNFIRMKPANQLLSVSSGYLNSYTVFAEEGNQYAIYIDKFTNATISIQAPNGNYNLEVFNPSTGEPVQDEKIKAEKGKISFQIPQLNNDVAIRIIRN